MKKLLRPLTLFLVLSLSVAAGPAFAQGEMEEFLTILRGPLKYPLEANIMQRLVVIEASPGFWSRINGSSESVNSHPVKYLKSYGSALATLAENMGLGDLDGLMYNIRDGNAPPIVGMIDSWKGKISLKIVLPFEPNDDTFAKTMAQTEIIANQLSRKDYLNPRGGEFHGTITYSDTATKATVKVSPDGNTYDIVIPIYMATASNLSAIVPGLKKGL